MRGVSIQRANTSQWLGLRLNAEAPFGVGDSLRTNVFGRAQLWLLDGASILILPQTTFTLSQFSADADGRAVVTVRLEGRAIIQITQSEQFAQWYIDSPHLQVVAPARHFAVQSSPQATYVIVAEGEASVSTVTMQNVTRLREYNGIRGTESLSSPIRLSAPASFAQVDGILDGCIGVISARNQMNLNVRLGPSEVYDVVGTVGNGDVVRLLGVSPNNERYRIAYKAGSVGFWH